MTSSKVLSCASVVLLAVILAAPVIVEAQVGRNTGVQNPNLASEETLSGIPHMNNEIIKGVIANRPFLSISEFHEFLSKSLNKDQIAEVFVKLFVPINLNTASEAEIFMVPGIGRRMKHEFEEYRPYKALIQFRREMSKYVKDDEVARMEQYVFVPIDLNTASDEDIQSIPGVGRRMLHEFKEYRPYQSMAQFRKEIGKYVNDKELARLERYVVINDKK